MYSRRYKQSKQPDESTTVTITQAVLNIDTLPELTDNPLFPQWQIFQPVWGVIGIFPAGIYQQFPPPPNSYSTHHSFTSHIPQPHHPLIHFHSLHTFSIFPTPEIMCFTIGPSGYKLPPGFETPPGFLRAAAAKAAAQAAAAENSTGDKSNSSSTRPEHAASGQGEKSDSTKAC